VTEINRENVQKVRDHIANLPPEHFRMDWWVATLSERGYNHKPPSREQLINHTCGTCACIGGWTMALLGKTEDLLGPEDDAGKLLGLSASQADKLFYPHGTGKSYSEYTIPDAVAVLDHLLATGEVNWSAALAGAPQ
jgi:hypothetical protein